MKLKPIFAWYDFWVGLFWDSKKRKLYLFPVPCFGVVFDFSKPVVTHAPYSSELLARCPLCGAVAEQRSMRVDDGSCHTLYFVQCSWCNLRTTGCFGRTGSFNQWDALVKEFQTQCGTPRS
jgi:hypothetical protein